MKIMYMQKKGGIYLDIKGKKIGFVLIAALIGDFVGMIASVGIWRFLS